MTAPVHYVGKLLCLSLFIIPSPLVEAKKVSHSEISTTCSYYHAEAAGNKTFARSARSKAVTARLAAAQRAAARKAELKMISLEANILFAEMQLADSGLDEKVLEYALMGYHRLLKKHTLHNTDILTICDFSQSSSLKRMYVIDMRTRQLLYRNYVAHGISSGGEFANSFSNAPESHKSSLGFYVTRNTYYGENGLSLRIDGMDRGFNSLAGERNIVIHGAPYVSERILHKYGVMGTTFGCPAIPEELTDQLIPLLKDGSCFFIYYPSKRYLKNSSVLNG
ncbi:MAG: murein L,D-transpeptidase catalytic domain family protein [Chitinophagaceae bacterium]|nr:murein L,D-transpeptidase catalytic domain family protein [Chitinophagaceae bacterium]